MEAIGVKFGADVESDDDSFFDLVFDSPHRTVACRKKDVRFVESPRDVLLTKNTFSNSKETSPVTTLLRSSSSSSSPKFKVFLRFSFRKSSSSRGETTLRAGDPSSKTFEIGEIESNRLSTAGDNNNSLRSQLMKETSDCEASPARTTSSGAAVPKYLKLIKPLYQKVWKRRNEKKANLAPTSSPNSSPMSSSRTGSFKISAKRLVKSRSASAAVGVPPPSAPTRRRDDSLMEKHDGIQGAVLYCKKSFNSSSKEISQLLRTSSDLTQEKSGQQGRHSCEVPIRCSF